MKGTETETKIYQNCIERKSCIEEVGREKEEEKMNEMGFLIVGFERTVPSSAAN